MSVPKLEVSDIQATILRPRPSPYKGEYVMIRIDEVAQGREMLHRIIPYITPAEEWWTPSIPAWLGIAFTYQVGIAFTYQGLKALGLPKVSLDGFPEEFLRDA
jgi:deferrochelatase/peroxidase EfeB